MKSILCDLCVSSEAGERKKAVVSRRGAEDTEKKADLGFYPEMVVVFPSANSASLAKRAREKAVVSRRGAEKKADLGFYSEMVFVFPLRTLCL
jgi:hypothetical protein